MTMCRNIKTLFNFEPPATEDEVQASALQFVRKLSGFNRPSQANEAAFNRAVDEVAAAARKLLTSLHTHRPPPVEPQTLQSRENAGQCHVGDHGAGGERAGAIMRAGAERDAFRGVAGL